MLAGIPVGDLVFLAISLVAAGAVTGLLAGVFGVGGGAVIVPILYEVFRVIGVPEDVRMPLCVGTSLAVIIPTSIRSFNAHRAKGMVDMSILKIWAVPVVLGVIAGSYIARFAPADLFKIIFVVVAIFSALRLLFASDRWQLGTEMPGRVLMT
ncbi:MAG: sulfite exporter TauE/SafE family protein, partial [Bosea sp. (in: a-proteobacteria)]|nr:sulfite exporter TauE/SafE family protein [Bosea sp. (in: a-proteobacteria)]